MCECNETPQNGDNEITVTKIEDPEKERAVRCLRWSFLFPLIIAFLFCVIDDAVHAMKYYADIQTHADRIKELLKWCVGTDSLGIILGYFSVTLITMAIFLFIQQFYFKIFAGLDENKALTMLVIAVINLVVYAVYLTRVFDFYGMTFFALLLVVFLGVYMWRCLNADVRNFSKHSSNKGGSKVFASPNS